MTDRKTKLAYLPFGTPQNLEPKILGGIDLLRTRSGEIEDYWELKGSHPDLHVQITMQLGQIYSPVDWNERDKSILHAAALLAHETPGLTIVPYEEIDAMSGEDRLGWYMDHVRLDNVPALDRYLREFGQLVGSLATEDLHEVDSVQIDTAAWTMERVRRYLGLELDWPELHEWARERCTQWWQGYCEGGARIPVMTSGGRQSPHLKFPHANGCNYERWGANHYWIRSGHYPTPYEGMLKQYQNVHDALVNPHEGGLGVSLNITPPDYLDHQEMVAWLRAHAIIFVVLRRVAQFRRVPLYWHLDRKSEALGSEMYLPDVPMVWDAILEQDWEVRQPLLAPHEFCSITRTREDGKELRLTAVVDEHLGVMAVREFIGGEEVSDD